MNTVATMVTERGQVSIPAQIRKQLHLHPGQRVIWEAISAHECKIMVVADSRVPGAVAMLGYAAKFRQRRRTSEWMTSLRDGEIE